MLKRINVNVVQCCECLYKRWASLVKSDVCIHPESMTAHGGRKIPLVDNTNFFPDWCPLPDENTPIVDKKEDNLSRRIHVRR